MAAIDSLFRLLTSQQGEALTLATDRVPQLTCKGEQRPLSMPPVGAALIESFVGELLPAEVMARMRESGDQETTIDHLEFAVTIRTDGEGWVIVARHAARVRGAGQDVTERQRGTPVGRTSGATPGALAPVPGTPAGPVDSQFDRWLVQALRRDASDLLICADGARLRVAGGLVELEGDAPDDDTLRELLLREATSAHDEALQQRGSTDLSLDWTGPDGERGRFRVNLFRHARGLAAALRPIRRDALSLEALRLPAPLGRLVDYPHGLVLVTGPAGAGKSTTLAALVEQLNDTVDRHVITLEDPMEHEYVSRRCLVHQREVGVHMDSLESGLRAALRETPDVILLGEMRDRSTTAAALTAAETGHLVLSTLHAGHGAMAVERIIDLFPEYQQPQVRLQLAQSLRAVVTQHLLPCVMPGVRARSGGAPLGCGAERATCGRLPVVELMVVNAAVSTMIREGRTHQLQSAIQTGRDEGMIPLDQSLAARVRAGEVTFETAASVTLDGGRQLGEMVGR